MDNQRIIAWGVLSLLLWLGYVTWQKDYAPPPAPSVSQVTPTAPRTSELPSLPSTESAATAPGTAAVPAAAATPAVVAAAGAQATTVHIRTDVLDITLSTQGGELQTADLLKYPLVKNQPDVPVRLFNSQPGPTMFLARSGLRAADGRAEPTHLAIYQTAATEYRLEDGQDELNVPLTWTDGQGVSVTKTYTFRRGSYAVPIRYAVVNQSPTDWKAASYLQLVRHYEHVSRSMFDVESYAYRGPAVYNGKSYRKLNVEKDDDKNYQSSFAGGWMAAMQHHFVVAAVPPVGTSYDYQLTIDANNDFVMSYRGPVQTVAAGATGEFQETVFVGPKLQDQLAATGPKLQLTADYGMLTIISRPLFWLLEKVYGFVGNWGWSIILTTFLIKLVFYKLTETSGRSMAKMRNLGPRIKAVQERFKDDREQLGRAMMDLYKKEKINPVAGCLPILVQIPVFLAYYWVLLESVEMRQAPFLGWISDLSSRDPYFVLPVLMGVAMFGQFKLNPQPPDPIQAKVFAFMPIIMTFMMAWFPAGLVLYWITNTVLSIAQQWNINRLVVAGNKKD
ncbi:MAG: membrane protein insertase YidC [Steroidobacteraceae bacterium]